MKSIEQVLKNKITFIEKKREKSLVQMMLDNRDGEKLIYETINLNIKSNIELLERIT